MTDDRRLAANILNGRLGNQTSLAILAALVYNFRLILSLVITYALSMVIYADTFSSIRPSLRKL